MIEFGEEHLPEGVRIDRSDGGFRLRLVADRPLAGLSNGWFTQPVASVEIDPATVPGDAEFLGFAFTQFALPVISRPGEDFDFNPAPNLHSPRAMIPLLVRSADGYTLLAPTSSPHEQIITVIDGVFHWGWHGDLDEVPAGFTAELAVYRGATAAELLSQWGSELQTAAGVVRRPADANALTSHLSYWTDNGAAYWYRTEPGTTIAGSVADAVRALRADDVPIRSVELDSWFYQHETIRPIDEIGYPTDVPPSGCWVWKPRPDAFPPSDHAGGPPGSTTDSTGDPVTEFADGLGRPPLVLHARHLAPNGPDVDPDTWWVDDLAAQPHDPAWFRGWFDDAVRWGATCIEQDWMLIYWFGVRALRSAPGRAMAWQRALDEHGRATGVDLLWCMATPADLIAAVEFERVIAVRTCDDYRFADDPAMLWTWFLTVNRLVGPLGLRAFKDCFFSNAEVDRAADSVSDPIDGDVHAEVEGLLSALSGGPVGIGDRIGRTDRGIVMRTCDADGRLRLVDHPIGLIDDCLFGAPARGERLAWATTSVTIDGSRWTYVVAINTATERRTIADRLDLTDVGLDRAHAVYEWRQGRSAEATSIEVDLAPRDWALFVCCPIIDGTFEVGDTAKYVTVASPTRS
ncbi:MAG: hypothetical protein ABWZ42_06450 [Ilumatobacteraceae bacterium]